jgi:hypothetical protein
MTVSGQTLFLVPVSCSAVNRIERGIDGILNCFPAADVPKSLQASCQLNNLI